MKQQIIEDYISGLSAYKIAKKYNIHHSTVYRYLEENDIPRRSNKINSRKYTFNENYFDTIDTEEKAYWLGFIFADGFQDKQNHIGMALSAKDKPHLEEFKKALNATYEIKVYKAASGYKPGAEYARLLCKSKHCCNQLSKLGAIPHKTLQLNFPTYLDDSLKHHFLRGYFDGDGSWSIAKNTKLGYQFKLCGTKDFLEGVCDILALPKKLYKKGNNFYISKGGKYVLKIMEYLYNDASIYLERKYKRFLDAKQKSL